MMAAKIDDDRGSVTSLTKSEGSRDLTPVGVAELLLAIARFDNAGRPLSVSECAQATGLSAAATSRGIAALSKKATRGSRGLSDLVEVLEHPTDHGRRVVRLTPRGQDLYDRLRGLADRL